MWDEPGAGKGRDSLMLCHGKISDGTVDGP